MSDDETNVEETIMLTRRERRRHAASPGADAAGSATATAPGEADAPDAADASEEAHVLEEADAPDEARAVEEADAPDEATVVVDRSSTSSRSASEPADDATVVVARDASRARPATLAEGGAHGGADDAIRPALTTAPDAVATPALYKPRPAPLAPAAPPVITGGAAPTRVADVERTSVVRQGRRWSVYALVAALAACVVSVAGLVGVGFAVFG